MLKIIRRQRDHNRYFMAIYIFVIPMMILIIFSQMAMEIYAYNFIARTNIEKNIYMKAVRTVKIKRESSKIKAKAEKIQDMNAESVEIKISDGELPDIEIEAAKPIMSLSRPIRGGVTTSCFGDISDRMSRHKGHDWAVDTGTEVVAAAEGVVEKAYYSDSYGYNVLIRHANGLETRYAHMSELNVTKDMHVRQNEVIGLTGTTGASTGPHLHFEVIEGGKRVNPLKFVKEY